VWPKHVAPLIKPLLTPYYRKESCDLTVINKAYIVTLHNGMDSIKFKLNALQVSIYKKQGRRAVNEGNSRSQRSLRGLDGSKSPSKNNFSSLIFCRYCDSEVVYRRVRSENILVLGAVSCFYHQCSCQTSQY
jgi:hypothetical protein